MKKPKADLGRQNTEFRNGKVDHVYMEEVHEYKILVYLDNPLARSMKLSDKLCRLPVEYNVNVSLLWKRVLCMEHDVFQTRTKKA